MPPSTCNAISIFRPPAKPFWMILLVGLSLLSIACGGSSHSSTLSSVTPPTLPPTTPPGAIPVGYWGLHVLDVTDFPALVPYGQFRNWDTQAQWPQIEKCQPSPASNPISTDPCFDWTVFDQETAALKNDPFNVTGIQTFQINDIFYTMSRTPNWASSVPTDASCTGAQTGQLGECDLPTDINADGSGTNQTWKNWVTALATHANGLDDPTNTYLQTHAHIKYWEPW